MSEDKQSQGPQAAEQGAPLAPPAAEPATDVLPSGAPDDLSVTDAPETAVRPDAVPEGLAAPHPEPELPAQGPEEPGAKPWGSAAAVEPVAPLAAPMSTPAPAASRRGGFIAPLIGGAIALGAGFAVSHFDLLQLRPAVDTAAIEARIVALDQKLAEVGAADAQLAERLDDVTGQLTSQAAEAVELRAGSVAPEAVQALEARLADFEAALGSLPAGSDGAAVAALASLRADLEATRSEMAALAATRSAAPDPAAVQALIGQEISRWQDELAQKAAAEADAIRAEAARDAARSALADAVSRGQPWQDLLAPAGIDPAPPALLAHAATGLPSREALAEAFAAPARDALEVMRRSEAMAADRSATDRMLSFLALQTGARSLSPREGDGPDALLSRVEAVLRAGDLPGALAGLDALPSDGAAPFATWRADAEARLAAEAALAAAISPK